MELTLDEKKAIIESRIRKLSEDSFQLELNYGFALDQNNEEAIENYKTGVSAVKASIEFHKKELAKLEL